MIRLSMPPKRRIKMSETSLPLLRATTPRFPPTWRGGNWRLMLLHARRI
jgi:hypothetical protein